MNGALLHWPSVDGSCSAAQPQGHLWPQPRPHGARSDSTAGIPASVLRMDSCHPTLQDCRIQALKSGGKGQQPEVPLRLR
eukprot:CAMPEP_0171086962 /NCGR_PEP_ID=MMETSP0766_2-20121228/19865_1 /TAXON_ID=439317 /ORGANISM="Gambierdiscus australes, Strain CAWD 149" /LENGTH=79 /DNA_ID=CAMNT_0011544637 /DNA_START=33 /DNA_END=269 /DNA_ORIENTATION=-